MELYLKDGIFHGALELLEETSSSAQAEGNWLQERSATAHLCSKIRRQNIWKQMQQTGISNGGKMSYFPFVNCIENKKERDTDGTLKKQRENVDRDCKTLPDHSRST